MGSGSNEKMGCLMTQSLKCKLAYEKKAGAPSKKVILFLSINWLAGYGIIKTLSKFLIAAYVIRFSNKQRLI